MYRVSIIVSVHLNIGVEPFLSPSLAVDLYGAQRPYCLSAFLAIRSTEHRMCIRFHIACIGHIDKYRRILL